MNSGYLSNSPIMIALIWILLSACTRVTPKTDLAKDQSSSLQGTTINDDAESLSPLALRIRVGALELIRKNAYHSTVDKLDSYELPSRDGKLPDLVKSILLGSLKDQHIPVSVYHDRPCFVDTPIISPTIVFEALQRAAVGRVPNYQEFDDKRLPTPPPQLRGIPWRKILNYSPEPISLLEKMEQWYQDDNFPAHSLSPQMRASLGIKKIDFTNNELKYAVLATLIKNGLVASTRKIEDFHHLSCLAASQVRGFYFPIATNERTEETARLLNLEFPFESTRLVFGYPWGFPRSIIQPGGLLETKNIVGLDLSHSNPETFERLLSPIVRQKIKQIIVSAAWLLNTVPGYTTRVFPNLETVEITDDDVNPIFGDAQMGAIDRFNGYLQEFNQNGVKNLRIQTEFSKILLPRIKPLHNIQNVVIDAEKPGSGAPCLNAEYVSSGVDIVQLARIFPRAKSVWIRVSRVLETQAGYQYLHDQKVDWVNLDFSSCIPNAKNTVFKLPKEVFPKLKSVKTHNCRLNIEEKLDLSRMKYDPMVVFQFKDHEALRSTSP